MEPSLTRKSNGTDAVFQHKSRRLSIFYGARLVGLNVEDERKRCGRYRHPMDAKPDRMTGLRSNAN